MAMSVVQTGAPFQAEDRKKWSDNIRFLASIQLDLPPSCIEFVPHFQRDYAASNSDLFVVGTYELQLEESVPVTVDADAGDSSTGSLDPAKPQTRNGSIILFERETDGAWYDPKDLSPPVLKSEL